MAFHHVNDLNSEQTSRSPLPQLIVNKFSMLRGYRAALAVVEAPTHEAKHVGWSKRTAVTARGRRIIFLSKYG